jgi:protein-disulfide isomerase
MKSSSFFIIATCILLGSACTNKKKNEAPIMKVEITNDDYILGDPNAPVTIIEFADFECPGCIKFYDLIESLRKDYFETGKVRLVLKNYPLSTSPDGVMAALACECAGEQDKYWKMYVYLFESRGDLRPSKIMDLAGALSLDIEIFTSCLQDPSGSRSIQNNAEIYMNMGINGTPTYIINDRLYEGAPSRKELIRRIEEHL